MVRSNQGFVGCASELAFVEQGGMHSVSPRLANGRVAGIYARSQHCLKLSQKCLTELDEIFYTL